MCVVCWPWHANGNNDSLWLENTTRFPECLEMFSVFFHKSPLCQFAGMWKVLKISQQQIKWTKEMYKGDVIAAHLQNSNMCPYVNISSFFKHALLIQWHSFFCYIFVSNNFQLWIMRWEYDAVGLLLCRSITSRIRTKRHSNTNTQTLFQRAGLQQPWLNSTF